MKAAIKTTVKSFCLSTSQHGFRFIYLEKRTLFEKCVWLVLIILCLIGIILYAWLIYVSYRDQLNIITTDTTSYPIWNYHFPAVTICNSNKISLAKIKASLHLFKDFTGTEYNITSFGEDIHHLYDIIHAEDIWHNVEMLQRVLDNNRVTIKDLFNAISPDCDVMVSCVWKGQITKCDKIFQKIPTVYGFCCSFNYYAVSNMSTRSETPERVSQCSFKAALQVLFNTKRNDYAAFDMHTPGFYVFIHNPYDYVDWNHEFVLLSQSSSNFISVAASMIYTTDVLLSKSPEERNCYIDNEKELQGFNMYTHTNCLFQCRMELMLKECKCVPYYFSVAKSRERVCNLVDIPCMLRMRHKIVNTNPKFLETCGCLGNCEHMEYTITYSGSGLPKKYNYYTYSMGTSDFTNHTMMRVFYNNLIFLRDKNDCQYDLPSLLATLGGILGLFNGISITSILEVIYFFTVRLYLNKKDQEKKQVKKVEQRIFTIRTGKEHNNFNRPPVRAPKTFEVEWIP